MSVMLTDKLVKAGGRLMNQVEELIKPIEIVSLIGDKILLPESIENLAASYRTAKPFPHVVIDNMFSDTMLDEVVSEIPPISDEHWVHHDHEHEERSEEHTPELQSRLH